MIPFIENINLKLLYKIADKSVFKNNDIKITEAENNDVNIEVKIKKTQPHQIEYILSIKKHLASKLMWNIVLFLLKVTNQKVQTRQMFEKSWEF